MKFIGKLIFLVFSNSVAILAADYLVSGFNFIGTFLDLMIAAGIFTLINLFIRPIFKLLFGPIILLTLGLFVIVINALTLYILDIFVTTLTIQGYMPLIIATLIFGIVNVIVDFSGKHAFK
ncbi:MAG: phage holin family protein [Candidatus Paceibacterota bacterium]